MQTAIYKTLFTKSSLMRLYEKINDDNVFNGAATLAYYSLFSLFPAMIFLLSLLPYLPIHNLHEAIMDFIAQIVPHDVMKQIEGVVAEVTLNKHTGLLSFGAVLTLWAASSGVYALMQQLDMTYEVKERRPFWKARGQSILLTILLSVMVIISFALIVLGGVVQTWLSAHFGYGEVLLVLFAGFRWLVILALMLLSFAIAYYFGPDVEQNFKFVTPGAVIGVVVLVLTTLGFRVYVENFGNYAATYGSLGAVIVLMLLLYIAGLVILTGSSINAMIEHKSPDGKKLGETKMPEQSRPKGALPPPKDERRDPYLPATATVNRGVGAPAPLREQTDASSMSPRTIDGGSEPLSESPSQGHKNSWFSMIAGVVAVGTASRKKPEPSPEQLTP